MDKILLCRIAWMKYYEGRANIDIPRSGSKYVMKHKTGGEIYNFKNRNGIGYGYIPNIQNVTIENLGANRNDDFISNITLVFCAKHPVEGGIRVVGWHEKTILYRSLQVNSLGNEYHTVTNFKNVQLIQEDDRIFSVHDSFGRNALYYITIHPSKKRLLEKLQAYIQKKGKVEVIKRSKSGRAYQPDLEKKLLVEQTAINAAKRYYAERYGHQNIVDVQAENKGWDLEIKAPYVKLFIEVKGLSGLDLFVEMTPREFEIFNKKSSCYQLFVLNNSLAKKPIQRIYKYQQKGRIWVGNDKSVLNVNIVKSARLNLK